jgi:transposase
LERDPDGLPDYIESILVAIEALNLQIAEADQALAKLAKRDGRCQRLMSVPGVGPVMAMRFVAAIDDVSRFEHAHAVEAYVGLTPGENSSGSTKRRTSITKAGSPRLRWALVQASWCFWRTRPRDPMVLWARQVADRRGKKIAIIALARKVAGVLYALLRDQSIYNPRHQAG